MAKRNKEFEEYKLNKLRVMLVDAKQIALSETVGIVLASDANAAIPTEVVVAWKVVEHMLNELKVDYMLVGALAMNQFRHPRYTDDVDIIISQEALPRLMSADITRYGLAFLSKSDNFIQLQEVKYHVKVDILISGTKRAPDQLPIPTIKELGKAHRTSRFGMLRLKLSCYRLGRDFDDLAVLIMGYDMSFSNKLHLLPEKLRDRYIETKGDLHDK